MPAMKKVTQFLGHKADYGCSRCLFQAEREESSRGASGNMSYQTSNGFSKKQIAQCIEYQQAKSKSEALDIQKKNGVRYSELIRLPYFDIIRMSQTDPMHTILLGLVHNEEKLCLSSPMMSQFYSHIQRVKVPYDIGHIPSNINGKTDLTSMTADQWKKFALIYARPCLSGLLSTNAYKSICFLCEIVILIAKPIYNNEDITTLYRKLNDHHKMYASVYGKWEVSVNYHFA